MRRRPLLYLLFALATLGTPACAIATRQHDQINDRLFFGRSIPSGGLVSDSAWSQFLAEVVTPKFPEGLTVVHGQGQWLDPVAKVVIREPVTILEVLHPPTARDDSAIAAVALEYKRRFSQQSVLHVRQTGKVTFF